MRVIDTRGIGGVIQRKNLCQKCNHMTTTYEAEDPALCNMIMSMMVGNSMTLLNRLSVDEIRALIDDAQAAIDLRRAEEETANAKRAGRRSRKN